VRALRWTLGARSVNKCGNSPEDNPSWAFTALNLGLTRTDLERSHSGECGTSPEDNSYWAFTALASGAQERGCAQRSVFGPPRSIGIIGSPLAHLDGSEPTDVPKREHRGYHPHTHIIVPY
jgi:hypothetical protein